MFDFIKNAGAKIFGGDEPHKEPTAANKSISSHIRDHGLDPSPLKFFFNADGTVDVSGEVESQELREKLILIVGNVRGIAGVNDKITIAAAAVGQAPDTTETGTVEVSGGPMDSTDGNANDSGWSSRTYTVKSGDTLWKISQEMYGNGSKYPKIFEANKPMLSDPDKIYPGQVLRIPALD